MKNDSIMVVTMTVKVPGGKRRIAEGRRVASKKGRYTEVGFCYFGLILVILVISGFRIFPSGGDRGGGLL